jgi:hypothetical protein
MFTKETKLKLAISFIIIIILSLIINGIMLFKNYQNEKEEAYAYYHFVADLYQLDYTYDGDQIAFIPTEPAKEALNRWEMMSDFYPQFDYPEELIAEGDWVAAYDIFVGNSHMYSEILVQMYDEAGASVSDVPYDPAIYDYVLFQSSPSDTFRNVLIELGFEVRED